MFGLKTLAAFAITAIVGVAALPSPVAAAGLEVAKREAAPMPVSLPEANTLVARCSTGGCGCTDVYTCMNNYCTGEGILAAIIAQISEYSDHIYFCDI